MSFVGVATAERFQLGSLVDEPTAVSGGILNRLWRVNTSRGCFAVKELNLARESTPDFDAVHQLELAALAAGVPLPRPIPDPSSGRPVAVLEEPAASVLVHEWVEGTPSPPTPVPPDFALRIGEALADLHQLTMEWSPADAMPPMPDAAQWTALADTAGRANIRWATRLADAAPALGRIGSLVNEWGHREEPMVVSHRDLNPKNLLSHEAMPIIIDWETAGWVPIAHELGATATALAVGVDLITFERDVFMSIVRGYRSRGGDLPEPGPHWFSTLFAIWTHTMWWNVERYVDGVTSGAPTDGQDLSVADSVVRIGIVALPRLLGSLDSLTDHVIAATSAANH